MGVKLKKIIYPVLATRCLFLSSEISRRETPRVKIKIKPIAVQNKILPFLIIAIECPLTQREREVLQLIGEGYTSVEIASKLKISETTVKTHRNNLMDKLNVRSVAGLTRQAIRFKLVHVE